MPTPVKLPFQFFSEYCDGFNAVGIRLETDPDFDLMTADLEEFRGEVELLRERAEGDGVLPEMKLALEYLISIDTKDIPQNEQHISVVGGFIDTTTMTGFDTAELHRLFEWTRAVNFPSEPPMTAADKDAAKKLVQPVEIDLDEWMEARGLERGSKPGVWAKRQEAARKAKGGGG